MTGSNWDWGFGKGGPFGPEGPFGGRGAWRRHRRHFFEPGDLKLVILRLLKEKPRHGYEVMKALEERTGGCYTPSAGTIYPTLQLLEDQGLVRIVEAEGKKVYHVTEEGEKYLTEHRGALEEIVDRVREVFSDLTEGPTGDVLRESGRIWTAAGRASRKGEEASRRVAEILRKAVSEIEAL